MNLWTFMHLIHYGANGAMRDKEEHPDLARAS
jgi:hypothetical protein